MTSHRILNDTVFIWKWGDREIENPLILKDQLNKIQSEGFQGVLVILKETRYEIIDKKVVRAVTQASQWARYRNMQFWFQSDPRRASRSLINRTGERTQLLLVSENGWSNSNSQPINLTQIKNNRFSLTYHYPQYTYSPLIKEFVLHFDPSGFERTFIFRMKNGVVIRDSVLDISSETRFSTNIAELVIEVFGEIRVPDDEEWWVIAFPRFDTNIYDYAGRESNDSLLIFVEDLFDGGAYIDGISWDEMGYSGGLYHIPASLSIYNCFKAEFGYDIRDFLYGLVIDLDDQFHIKIRCDYYQLLTDLIYSAKDELYEKFHTFFGDILVGLPQTWKYQQNRVSHPATVPIDSWKGLDDQSVGMGKMSQFENLSNSFSEIISMCIITKSLGVYSAYQKSYFWIDFSRLTNNEIHYLSSLMGLFSIRLLVDGYGTEERSTKMSPKELKYKKRYDWQEIKKLTQRLKTIQGITDYQFPISNVLLIFPIETLMNAKQDYCHEILGHIYRLIAQLFCHGIQLEVISPWLLKNGKFTVDGLKINDHVYQFVIYPYPEILRPEILELISKMDKYGFPIYFGGCRPQYTSKGKRIPHQFSTYFEMEENQYDWLWREGVASLLQLPENGIGTIIQNEKETFILICPKNVQGATRGVIQYQDIQFKMKKSRGLSIFRRKNNNSFERII